MKKIAKIIRKKSFLIGFSMVCLTGIISPYWWFFLLLCSFLILIIDGLSDV